ncbi:UDP-N-acetylmuramate--L-alanine ligase [Streptomyces xiaopingdaonensis]|uniref:UDP-N-acetylmuramate--L-alanine ligase n=1 Tax=Streptomyces xiaopingdaonensis TaxID=1565415 RepID=UPI0003103F7A|nr:UDP-N-acetylmuramate--L-alanine ligase [Streptomyces xiaopingdaonensis]
MTEQSTLITPHDVRPAPPAGGPGPAGRLLSPVHFVGIGGAGMSAVARILASRGVTVSGTDAKESPRLAALRALGVGAHVGHDPAHLPETGTVVTSGAVAEDNPELARARALGLPVVPRAAALAAVMEGHRRIAVAGTAGKTSTSGMLTTAAAHCGADPSFAIGSELGGFGTNAHHGAGDLFVAEADESDGSFLLLSPEVAIVTNVGSDDHLDFHGTPERYARVFEEFAHRVAPGGVLIANDDDPGAARLAEVARSRVRVRTFGESPTADLRLTRITVTSGGTTYGCSLDGAALPGVRIASPGRHMAQNSAAALLAALELGLPAERAVEGLAEYRGVARRFEFRGAEAGVRVYDDYAHNPTKVGAQLRAARQVAGDGRLIVVFQPPLFTTTRRFPSEFAAALGQADEVLVLDVSRAREKPIEGVTGALIADRVPLPADRVHYCPERAEVVPRLAGLARSGDLVLTVGTGDVTTVGPEYLARLRATAEH